MTITPYSISESTKISDAYLKNVVNEGAKGNGILKRGGEWLGKKVGRWVNRGADDAAKAATSGADNVAAKAATSGADNVAAKAATSGADNVAAKAATSGADNVAAAGATKTGVVGKITDNGRKILHLVPNGAKKVVVTVPAVGYATKVCMDAIGSGIESVSTAINGKPLPPDAPDGHKSWNQLLKEFVSEHPYLTIGAILIPVIKYIVSKVGIPLIDAIKKKRDGVSGKEFVIVDNGKYLHSNGFSETVSKDIVIFKNRADAESAIDALSAVTKSNYRIEELSKVIG